MKRGLAGLVLGAVGLVSAAHSEVKLPDNMVPSMREPYGRILEAINIAKKEDPDMRGIFIKSSDKKRSIQVDMRGNTVFCMRVMDPPYVYHSIGLYGQLNDVWKEDKFYVINKIGSSFDLPMNPLWMQERMLEELALIENPIDISEISKVTARNMNYQAQFQGLMDSFYLDQNPSLIVITKDLAEYQATHKE